jgi:hypothetical protein
MPKDFANPYIQCTADCSEAPVAVLAWRRGEERRVRCQSYLPLSLSPKGWREGFRYGMAEVLE